MLIGLHVHIYYRIHTYVHTYTGLNVIGRNDARHKYERFLNANRQVLTWHWENDLNGH